MALGLLPHFTNTAALRYFYEVARYGSFQLAEEKIHIAGSAIRRQIQLLEEEIGTKLFIRERSGLRLTAAGESLLYRVRRAMKELSSARVEIDVLQGMRTGNVRIGINETVARDFLPTFIQKFGKQYPRITFEITVANSTALATLLLRSELDIIAGYAVEAKDGMQQVLSVKLQTCVTVHKDHPLAKRPSVRVSDLVDETFILPSADSTTRQIFNTLFARVAVKPVSNVTTNSFEFIGLMVARGMGIGCQVSLFTGRDPARPDLVYVPVRDAEVQSASLGCCIAAEGPPNMATSVCLKELCSSLEQWCSRHSKTPKS
jgi:DNA-binding transcriptional LysR family regulator